jgi:hypothetical protein
MGMLFSGAGDEDYAVILVQITFNIHPVQVSQTHVLYNFS